MRLKSCFLTFCVVSLGLLQPLRAQQKPGSVPQWIASQSEIASRLGLGDTTSRFVTAPGGNARLDTQEGVLRAWYRIDASGAGLSGSAQQRATTFLDGQRERFGFSDGLGDLELVAVESGAYSSHVTYRQTFFGLPVYNRRVKVNLDASGRPTSVMSAYAPGLARIATFDTRPRVAASQVEGRLRAVSGQADIRATAPELVVVPEETPRLAWRTIAWPHAPAVEIELLFDAHTGELIAAHHLSTHAKPTPSPNFEFRLSNFKSQHPIPGIQHPASHPRHPAPSIPSPASSIQHPASSIQHPAPSIPSPASSIQHPASSIPSPASSIERRALSIQSPIFNPRSAATGRGFVFDPDPLSVSGFYYDESFGDGDDADVPALNSLRTEVDLPDIELGIDGMYRLNGPHVRIVPESSGGAIVYTPPAEASPDGFKYTRSNDFFEAVNVYYHIDKSQRYLQSLNVGHDIQNAPIPVNPHGLGLEDNSRYFSAQNYIAFGAGGVDDAEDAHVIWHEYGHALLQGSAPGLLFSKEGQALHEGWADYWATSYARSLVEEGVVERTDWQTLFKWDSGDGSIWAGRQLLFAGKYPDDTFCDQGAIECDIYVDGMLWASTLMEIYDELGRETTDRLNLASHAYLEHPVTFRDAAEMIVQADADLYAGEHVDFLIQTFNQRGLIDPETFGPVASHEAIASTEQLGGTVPVAVEAVGVSAPIEDVFVVYAYEGVPQDTLYLTAGQNTTYGGLLPLPASPGTVSYYALIRDEHGLVFRLPSSSAPDPTYAFEVGPDTEPPTLQHNALSSTALIDWPALLVAVAEDNLGVDYVAVDYYIDSPEGERLAEGAFQLEFGNNRYEGVFPVSVNEMEPGSIVFYRLTVQDRAAAANQTRVPETGYISFRIVIEDGVFRSYDFEKELDGFVAEAPWQRGKPAYGVETAHSGRSVWATNLGAAYPQTAERYSLELPPLNLRGISGAHLVFWHWYDLEHDGDAFPESALETVLWDGGNVKISTDEGATWTLLEPVSGYNGTIASGRENPMAGEPAFGGYSYGWRQVTAPLPAANVRIRFDFGTDGSNSATAVSFAGWYLDDIEVLASLSEDAEAPVAVLAPESVIVRDPGHPLPEPYIELEDDTGIASAFVDYASYSGSNRQEGRFRLAMDPAQRDVFGGVFPDLQSAAFAVGDSVLYRFEIADFAGNVTVVPPQSEPPYRIEYRLRETVDLLGMSQATGLWKPVGSDAWALTRDVDHETVSSLVFGPLDLPANVDNLGLLLFYQHQLLPGHGGNVKLSTDGAQSWHLLTPVGGYNTELGSDETIPLSMRNQGVFAGQRPNLQQAQFDLLDQKGRQIWLRIDFGAQSELSDQEYWRIQQAILAYSTLEAVGGGFDVPRAFDLHANYPDPFSATTTVSYTLSEATPVALEVFDVLGRRVETLVEEVQNAGTYTVRFDGSRLSNGLYLVRLTTDQGQKVERMIVSR